MPDVLRPANKNPWYCLATIEGEQPFDHWDQALADKNRTAWLRWVGGSADRPAFENMFANRTGGSLKLPDPNTTADFSHTNFDRRVDFRGFAFQRLADFRSATFSGEANFGGAQFNDKADFTSATFSSETDFSNAQFNIGANFRSTTFSKKAIFRYVPSFADADFRSATFLDTADFNLAKFRGVLADFSSTRFSDIADFASAEFVTGAVFYSATFSKTASFDAVKFKRVSFSETKFCSVIHFINTEFNGRTIFALARFEALPPDLRGAKMHEATEWHGVRWPRAAKSEAEAQQQVYSYERLKQEMEQRKKHEDEQNFFRMELRARRRLLRTSPVEWLLNFAYETLSGYGNSFVRPMLWLMVAFAAGIAIFTCAPLYCGAPMPIRLAAKLSFANIFVFLPSRRELMMTDKMIECLSNTTQAVSAAQSLIGVVLLFLLGLALRNRFRMR